MRPPAWRRLTAGERALAAEQFGVGFDAGRVRLLALPLWGRAFVAGPALMVWPARSLRADFAGPAVPLADQAVFVHELVHVWQAQRGVNLLLAKIKAGDGAAAYAYDPASGLEFPQMNIEQQAMVVEDAFRLSRGGAAPHPAAFYAAQRRHWAAG
jgi:hypothetical protein